MLQIFIVENDDNFRDVLSKTIEQIKIKNDMKADIVFSGKDPREFLQKLKQSKEHILTYFLWILIWKMKLTELVCHAK